MAPASSGTRRRPRERTSNQPSITSNGSATTPGTQNQGSASTRAPPASAASTTSSTAATFVARRVRSSVRPRRRSTATIFNGVRTRNATIAPAATHSPAGLGASSRPRSPGSSVRPHPPCSAGRATERNGDRASDRPEREVVVGHPPEVPWSEARLWEPSSSIRLPRARDHGRWSAQVPADAHARSSSTHWPVSTGPSIASMTASTLTAAGSKSAAYPPVGPDQSAPNRAGRGGS